MKKIKVIIFFIAMAVSAPCFHSCEFMHELTRVVVTNQCDSPIWLVLGENDEIGSYIDLKESDYEEFENIDPEFMRQLCERFISNGFWLKPGQSHNHLFDFNYWSGCSSVVLYAFSKETIDEMPIEDLVLNGAWGFRERINLYGLKALRFQITIKDSDFLP